MPAFTVAYIDAKKQAHHLDRGHVAIEAVATPHLVALAGGTCGRRTPVDVHHCSPLSTRLVVVEAKTQITNRRHTTGAESTRQSHGDNGQQY